MELGHQGHSLRVGRWRRMRGTISHNHHSPSILPPLCIQIEVTSPLQNCKLCPINDHLCHFCSHQWILKHPKTRRCIANLAHHWKVDIENVLWYDLSKTSALSTQCHKRLPCCCMTTKKDKSAISCPFSVFRTENRGLVAVTHYQSTCKWCE